MNGPTAIALAVYMAAVGFRGNSGAFLTAIAKEGAFFHWAVSLALLLWLRRVAGINPIVDGIISLAFLALFLNPNHQNLINNLAGAANWLIVPSQPSK